MAVESKRSRTYRKVGGLYLVADALMEPCHRLPLPLPVCPTCKAGIKPSPGWTWVEHGILGDRCWGVQMERTEARLAVARETDAWLGQERHCEPCPICNPPVLGREAGLLWVGLSYYPTAREFLDGACQRFVSRRIPALPTGFVAGKTWVLLGHRKGIWPNLDGKPESAIISAFRPKAVELILRESDATPERIRREYARGVTVVAVPDGDPDHDPRGARRQVAQAAMFPDVPQTEIGQ